VARVGAQVAEALEYAAGQGVLHRDVKPSNILLDARGDAWVTDFGLAKAQADGENLTHTGDIIGTLRYMAPERFEGHSDLRSDLYALGLTLYEMLTLRPAFAASDRNALVHQLTTQDPPAPRSLDRSIPRDLETVVLKATAREPGRRYQTAGELAEDLRRYLADRPVLARRVGPAERLWRWCRRNPAVAALAATVATLLVALAVASVTAAVHAGQLAERERLNRDEADRQQIQAENDLQQAERERVEAEDARQRETDLRAKAQADQADAEKSGRDAAEAARQAQAHSQKARLAVDDFVTRVSDSPALRGPEMRRLRHDLLASALPFYREFIARHAADPEARDALAGAYFHAGEIHRSTGNAAEAGKAYQAALALYQELAWADRNNTAYQIGLARCYARTGSHQEASRVWDRLLAADRGNAAYQAELAQALDARAAQLAAAEKTAEALSVYERAVGLWRALANADPDNTDARAGLARTAFALGRVLEAISRGPDAVPRLAEGVLRAEEAFSRNPQTLEYGRLLAAGYGQLADLHRALNQAEAALPWYEKAVELWKQLAEDNPSVPSLHGALYAGYRRLAACQRGLGREKEADEALRAAGDLLDQMPRETPEELFNAGCVLALAACHTDPEEAKPTADRAVDAINRAVAAGFRGLDRMREEEDLELLRSRQDFQELLARAERAEKTRLVARSPDAVEAERRHALLATRADLAAARYAIGVAQAGLNNTQAAREVLTAALAEREALVRDDPEHTRDHRADVGLTRVALGHLDWRAGRLAEATAAWRQGLDMVEAAVADGPRNVHMLGQLAASERAIGNTYWAVGLWDEAADYYLRSFAHHRPGDIASWTHLAYLLLYRGDLASYRRHCEEMRKRFARDIFGLVSAATAGPGAVADPADLVRRAEREEAARPRDGWRLFNLILANYRAGRFDLALEHLRRGYQDHFWDAITALACDGAGRRDEARDWLRRADLWHDSTWRDALATADPRLPTWIDVYDQLRLELLRREVHQRLDGQPPPDDSWRRLLCARVYFKLGQADRAEAALKAAVAARPDDPEILLARGRVLAEQNLKERAEADFARAGELKSADPMPWIRYGHYLAGRGRHAEADAAFAHAAALTAGELNRFPEAGWWVVGPYPPDLKIASAPEKDPDPSKPVPVVTGKGDKPEEVRWRPASTDQEGGVDMRPLSSDNAAAYALTYIHSPKEQTATICIGGGGPARLWFNGRLVYHSDVTRGWPFDLDRVPVTLRAGRNTLLVKVVAGRGNRFVNLRLGDAPLSRGLVHAQLGEWKEAVIAFRQWYERWGPPEVQNSFFWRVLGPALLASGDAEGHRRYCTRIFGRFGQTTDVNHSFDAAGLLTLTPGAIADTDRLVQLAEKGLTPNPKENWRQIVVLLAYLRAGQYERVLKQYEEYAEVKILPESWLALALAHYRLGHADEARRWLKKANDWYDEETRTILDGRFRLPRWGWWDYAQFRVLRAEAQTLIDGAVPKEDANFQALRARVGELCHKHSDATADYDLALLLNPDQPRLWLARAARLAELERQDESQADIARGAALRPGDPQFWEERRRIFAEMGLFDRDVEKAPADPRVWIDRARHYAELGQRDKADADLAEAAKRTPNELTRFPAAGWWVAGPYPEDLKTAYPPEKEADPSRPAAAVGGAESLPWRPVVPDDHGMIDFGPALNRAEHACGYALTYVWSPDERPTTLLVGGDDRVRVWLNGRLAHEIPDHRAPWAWGLERVPVTLRAGRNTLLVKVSNITGPHSFYLRLADNPWDRAVALAELGLWAESAEAFGKLFERGLPDNQWLWHAYALVLQAAGDSDGYRRHRACVIERVGKTTDPASADNLGNVCNLAPDSPIDYARLVDLDEQWLKADPKAPWRIQRVGITRLRAGQFKEAMRNFEEARSADFPDNYPLLAVTCWRLGRTDEARAWLTKAEEWYDKAVKKATADGRYQPWFGRNWFDLAVFEVFRREARTLIDGKPPKDDANGQALRAAAREWLKKRDPATADFDHALLVQPDQARLWEARGRRLGELKRWDAAVADLDRWLTLAPAAPELWWSDLALLDGEMGQWDEVFARVVKRRPKEYRLWVAHARRLGRRGQWDEAARALAQTTALNPADHVGWYDLAAVLLERGETDGYRRAAREMLTRFARGDTPEVADRTAKTCLLTPDIVGDPKEVMRLAEQAVTGTEQSPVYAWFLSCRALADYRAGDFSAAVRRAESIKASPDGGPGEATVFTVLALARHRLGHAGEARDALAKADAIHERKWPKLDRGESFGDDWPDWVRFQILRREAAALIAGKAGPTK
jgi:tetratricopeptide (TPR) repeat protein